MQILLSYCNRCESYKEEPKRATITKKKKEQSIRDYCSIRENCKEIKLRFMITYGASGEERPPKKIFIFEVQKVRLVLIKICLAFSLETHLFMLSDI